jgi:hypothetical protein
MVLIEADKTQRLKLVGEDTCDLLRVIEASFGVKFTEDEFVEAKTIGELADCIFTKLAQPLSEKCLSAVVFYRLRRTFIRLFDTSRANITPETPLRELMPWRGRKRQWRRGGLLFRPSHWDGRDWYRSLVPLRASLRFWVDS